MRKVRNEFGYVEFCKRGIAMKIPFLSRKSKQLSEQQIDAAMERLRRLRIEVALVELETELRRSEVRVLRPKGFGMVRPSSSDGEEEDQ